MARRERPEIYTLHNDGGNWKISRRHFLKVVGIGTAAFAFGLNKAAAQDVSFYDACLNTAAHESSVYDLAVSADGKYLVSRAFENISCWDFDKQILLGKVPGGTNDLITGYFGGRSCIFLPQTPPTYFIRAHELPLTDGKYIRIKLPAPNFRLTSIVFDASENIYAVLNDKTIFFYSRESDYQEKNTIYESPDEQPIYRICLFDQEKKLFVQLGTGQFNTYSGFGVLDLTDNSMTVFDGECNKFSIIQGKNQTLISTKTEYRLVSLEDGSFLWSHNYPDAETSSDFKLISEAAVTPDGTTGILLARYGLGTYVLSSVSMADGYLSNNITFDGMPIGVPSNIVVNSEGTKCVGAFGPHILYFSLPELRLIGCPVDYDALYKDQQCIVITGTDPDTGEDYKQMLPCGSPVPSGAVCTCNCVSGKLCVCDSFSPNYSTFDWRIPD